MIRSQRPGVNRCRILAAAIWLSRCIRHAELVKSDSLDAALAQFVADRLDALAGLKPRLLNDVEQLPGARILDGQFSAVQQAIGTTALARARSTGATKPKALKNFGVTKHQSSKWQQLAAVPKDQFEAALAAPKEAVDHRHPRTSNERADQLAFRCATPRRSMTRWIS
jgi:hypothetical protein